MAFTYGSVTNCKVVNGQTRKEYECRLGYQVNSQSIENNTSNITLRLEVRSINSTYYTFGYSQTTTIDGTSLSASKFDMRSINSWQVFGTRTFNVSHNSDGTYSATKSGSFTTNCTSSDGGQWALKSGGASVTVAPPTIPRATTPTLSSNTYEMGQKITINTPRVASSFAHELYFKIGNSAKTLIAKDVATSFDWTDNLYLINWLPNAVSGTVTIYCQTYNGGTYIGEKTVTFTGKVPSNITPKFESFTVEEYVEDVKTKIGKYVKGKSQLSISGNAVGNYASEIVSYKITANGETFNTSEATTNVLTTSGVQMVTMIATDSRGRTASRGVSIEVIDYYLPQAIGIKVNRCNSDGTLNEDGEYLKATYSYNIAPIDNLNDKNVSIQYLDDNDSWQTLTTFDRYSAADQTYISNITFDTSSSYQIKLVVEDYFSKDEVLDILKTAFTLMNYHTSGTGMAIGKVAEEERLFDVALDTKFRSNVDIEGDLTLNGENILNKLPSDGGGDTLPIGTIVDYDGDTVPVGYEEVEDESEYSTEEIKIGTWFGKPLYRTTITKIITSNTTYNETILFEKTGIEQVVNMYGVVGYANGVQQIGAYANSSYYSLLQYNKQYNRVYFYGANNYVGYSATVTIEYTKTTD